MKGKKRIMKNMPFAYRGHVFKDKGFFITPDAKPDSTWHNWTRNVSQVYLWDQTKVTLQGRVVGGKDQGELPLGESLSKNNLGDGLTLVFQLEDSSGLISPGPNVVVQLPFKPLTVGSSVAERS